MTDGETFSIVNKNERAISCRIYDYRRCGVSLISLSKSKKIMKKAVWMMSLLFGISCSLLAQKSAVFNPAEGAIHGYDPVAYFKENKAVKGDEKYSLSWNSATWYFSNSENLNTFKANPEMYAPQFGGYCAYGMANGHKAPTDPHAWSIIDNKLYLNYSKDVQKTWKTKSPEYIQTANKNWPEIKDKE